MSIVIDLSGMPTMMEPSKAHPVQPASAIARTFRFGAWLKSLESPSACAELAQRAERLGYSTVFVGEHLHTGYGPFAMASALASATSLLRVGTLMLLNDLRHPPILAKEAAALDVLSGGRLELGIGAGWKDTDYTSIGLCMPKGPVRVQQLRESTLRSPDQSRSSVHRWRPRGLNRTNHDESRERRGPAFTAAELLRDDTTTWMSIWHEGKLVVAQGRWRLYWELSRISPSGVTGATGSGETVSDPVLDDIAQRAVMAIDKHPQGLFGVDLAYDKDGTPNPTEINIGRLFTTHQFFTELGLNMPYIFTKLAYGEKLPHISRRLNPARNHMVWIRGMDFEPVLVSMADISKEEARLDAVKRELTT